MLEYFRKSNLVPSSSRPSPQTYLQKEINKAPLEMPAMFTIKYNTKSLKEAVLKHSLSQV